MVQKAIVILAMQPIFGPLRTKLGMVTRAFFAQRDLNNVKLLEEFYETLESGVHRSSAKDKSISSDEDGNTLYMGTSIRECVHKWRFRTLMLLKLILLQKRIMVYGYPVEHLCTLQYSLVSLIPALLPHLQDAAAPELNTLSKDRVKAESLRMSDRDSLLAYMGLPLPLFSHDAFFQPYCPLQQIDNLRCKTWLIGTTNQIFKHQKTSQPDVIVDLYKMQLSFLDPTLQNLVSLTPADRKWMDDVINVVQSTWNSADPAQPVQMQYKGSDDYLRARFEEYVFGLLSTAKYCELHSSAGEASSLLSFGSDFVEAFRQTSVFQAWHQFTDETLCELIPGQHPCSGKTTVLSDVAIRLQAGINDLNLEENLGPTRERIGAAWQAGSASLMRAAHTWRQDLGRMTASYSRNDAESSESTPKLSNALSAWQATSSQGAAALSQFGSYLSTKQREWYGSFTKSSDKNDDTMAVEDKESSQKHP